MSNFLAPAFTRTQYQYYNVPPIRVAESNTQVTVVLPLTDQTTEYETICPHSLLIVVIFLYRIAHIKLILYSIKFVVVGFEQVLCIEDEKLKTGEKLPSIRELAEQFQCSKNTVVKALIELENQHIVYASYLIKNKEYVRAMTNLDHHYKDKTLYLELSMMDRKTDFFAIDETGEEIRGIVCNFNGSRMCTLRGGYYGLEEVVTPYIKYTKGTARREISLDVKTSLLQDLNELQLKFERAEQILKQRFNSQKEHFSSVFIQVEDTEKLIQSAETQLSRYQLQIQDCERLDQLCRS